ncbi:MAG: asparagine--tRNA ligase [Thermoanaerobaculales bacterium]|jgi:asparaginyl-tRNA synthetase|nr:asparagine--tRNA ligase [Thermoanaerobaculales bacterium]
MAKRYRVKQLLAEGEVGARVLVKGWVRTRRDSKEVSFLEVNDGSCLKSLQVVVKPEIVGEELKRLVNGCSVAVSGALVESPGKGQRVELAAEGVTVLGDADAESYPLQKKGHSWEFLRTIPHLRVRSNSLGAVFRIRNEAAAACHRFFQDRGFVYLHTPIITGSDCEGAGTMFQVTALDLEQLPMADGGVDYGEDFFAKPAKLTVSGQLQAEAFACALSDVYTFGPTFRAENSNTPRHLAEFWMLEPEMAFYDLEDTQDLAEEFLKVVIGDVMERCADDIALLNRWVDKQLVATLEHVRDASFRRMNYTEAVEILQASGRDFEYPVEWGASLQAEHERYLTEKHFKRPLILTGYPKEVAAFYMRLNDDGKTVRAMDVLVPRIGEIIGGSQREERLDVLTERIAAEGMPLEEYEAYLDLRRFGTVEHSGFGLGFERLVMFLTGMKNIRDVIPFPRTPRNLEF